MSHSVRPYTTHEGPPNIADKTQAVKRLLKPVQRWMAGSRFARLPLLALSRMGLLPSFVWRRLWVDGDFVLELSTEHRFRYRSTYGDTIGNSLYWKGITSYEYETVAVFYELARQSRVVLDIGANTGLYTLIGCVANPQVRVFAFEPVPHIFKRLVSNIELNGWQNRCDARAEAVTDFVGTTRVHVPYGNLPTWSSLNPEGFRDSPGSLLDVPAITVDELCWGKQRVDLVKIDVEGFEDRVLIGMRHVLKESAPTIILEANPDGPLKLIDEILSAHGYRFFLIRPEGIIPIRRIIPDANDIFRNVLCCVEDRLESTIQKDAHK